MCTPRPTSITDEMNATFDDFVVAFEKFAADIGKAGSECHDAFTSCDPTGILRKLVVKVSWKSAG